MPNLKTPKLTLVGAGPGDPDLISVKGVKALKAANVILYDALAHPSLLDYANEDCIKIFVGKKVGVCQFKQEDINQLIVDNALEHGHVVRLKGGDPFVFGRGHEEIRFAREGGVQEIDIVPGISSTYSLAELQQVPITRRGINESFWVMTGTTRNHEPSQDIAIAAKSTATIVILMGMRKLAEIVKSFQNEGKGETAVMIIQNGSLPEQKVGLGTINTIEEVVAKEGLSSPAVIIIGEVVRLHKDFFQSEEFMRRIEEGE